MQVGVAGHEHVLVEFAFLDELVEEQLHALGNLHELAACKELQIHQNLVVARPSRVYLLAHIAELSGEHQLHLGVHVFHALLDNELPLLATAVDVAQGLQQLQ